MFKRFWLNLLAALKFDIRDQSGKFSVEEWNALSKEEQEEQEEEIPDELKGGGSTVEELTGKIEALEKQQRDSDDKHSKEVGGIIQDLRQERSARQTAEEKLNSKSKEDEESEADVLKDRDSDDPITVEDLRKIQKNDSNYKKQERANDLRERASDRMDRDEDRMRDRTSTISDQFPVSFDEAMDAFEELSRKDKSLWDDVNREAMRRGGRPAKIMYDLAVTKHPELSKKVKGSEREKIIEELETSGKIKRVKSSAGGDGEPDLESMGDEEILALAEENPAAIDRALTK